MTFSPSLQEPSPLSAKLELPEHKIFQIIPLVAAPKQNWWKKLRQRSFDRWPSYVPQSWNQHLNQESILSVRATDFLEHLKGFLTALPTNPEQKAWKAALDAELNKIDPASMAGQACWQKASSTRDDNDQGHHERGKLFLPSKDFLDPFYDLAGGDPQCRDGQSHHYTLAPKLRELLSNSYFSIYFQKQALKRLGLGDTEPPPLAVRFSQIAISLYPGDCHQLVLGMDYRPSQTLKDWPATLTAPGQAWQLIAEANYALSHTKASYRSLSSAVTQAVFATLNGTRALSKSASTFMYTGIAFDQAPPDLADCACRLARQQSGDYKTQPQDDQQLAEVFAPFQNIRHSFSLEGGATVLHRDNQDPDFLKNYLKQTFIQSYLPLARLSYQQFSVLTKIAADLAQVKQQDKANESKAKRLAQLNAQFFEYQQKFNFSLVSTNPLLNKCQQQWRMALVLEAQESHIKDTLEQLETYVKTALSAGWLRLGRWISIGTTMIGTAALLDNLLEMQLFKGLWPNIKLGVEQMQLSTPEKWAISVVLLAAVLWITHRYIVRTGNTISISNPDD